MSKVFSPWALLLVLCVGCSPEDSAEYDASRDSAGLDDDFHVEVSNIQVRSPTGGERGCVGTALLTLSRNGAAVAYTRPALAALVPGLEAAALSPDFATTNVGGVLPIRFQTTTFPFDVLVRLPTSEVQAVSIDYLLPDGGVVGDLCEDSTDAGVGDGGVSAADAAVDGSLDDAGLDGGM